MSDGEPGSSIAANLSLILISSLLLCFLLAGMVSSFVTVLRMRRQGLVNQETAPLPGERMLSRPRPVLLTLSLAYLFCTAIAAACLMPVTQPWVARGGPLSWLLAWLAFFVALLAGSVLMKAWALSKPVDYMRSTLWLLWPLFVVMRPLSWGLEALLDRLAPTLEALDVSPPFSGGEIRSILADEESAGLMEEDERSLVRGVFDLRETELREVMVPRIDMKGIDVETSFAEAVAFATDLPYTRLPVWKENQDNIIGVLHSKDLLRWQAKGKETTVQQLLRPVHFLPESKNLDEALAEFRERRVHLAVVVDEYGGTAGIVTMEDILEEIVGEIRDEFDQEKEPLRVMDEHRAIIDPRIDIDDLNEALGLTLPADDSDTLGGFLYAQLGRMPSRGDTVEHEGLHFTIDRVERQRMLQVTLRTELTLPREGGAAAAEGGIR